ncbi:GGDEF domain-containing protein [Pleionea sediminis]|uniref:GGDEF domain-containing protein n=1 Tax=Pleionea sediminis TaxID=2569479 RepID=UPI001185B4B3|nr:diguanylate cyclase [Pleionea sediminis]
MKSISSRLAVIYAIAALLIALLQFAYNSYQDFSRQHNVLQQDIERIFDSTKGPAAQAIYDMNTINAQQILDGLKAYNYLLKATIYDELNQEFVSVNLESTPQTKTGTEAITHWLLGRVIESRKSTLQTQQYDSELGDLIIFFSWDIALQPYYANTISMLTSGLIRTFLVFLVIYFVTHLYITQHLNRIVHILQNIFSRPREQQNIRVPKIHKNTEIGMLIDVLNTTNTLRNDAEVALKNLNEELEQKVAERTKELQEANKKLKLQATLDSLTKVNNRRYFMELADKNLERCRRYNRPMCIMMLDIDLFKKINDEHGHKVGDEALIICAQTCLSTLRTTDILGRLGGEEFAILLPETTESEAEQLTRRLIQAMPKNESLQQKGIHMTVSIGLYQMNAQTESVEYALDRADAALYEAKNAGRDRYSINRINEDKLNAV